jgi:hypothetical protein
MLLNLRHVLVLMFVCVGCRPTTNEDAGTPEGPGEFRGVANAPPSGTRMADLHSAEDGGRTVEPRHSAAPAVDAASEAEQLLEVCKHSGPEVCREFGVKLMREQREREWIRSQGGADGAH